MVMSRVNRQNRNAADILQTDQERPSPPVQKQEIQRESDTVSGMQAAVIHLPGYGVIVELVQKGAILSQAQADRINIVIVEEFMGQRRSTYWGTRPPMSGRWL